MARPDIPSSLNMYEMLSHSQLFRLIKVVIVPCRYNGVSAKIYEILYVTRFLSLMHNIHSKFTKTKTTKN